MAARYYALAAPRMPLLDIPFVLCSDSPFQGMTAIPVFFWIAQFFSRTAIIPISIRAMIIRVHITRRTIVPIRIATDTHGSELPPFFQPHFHVSEACIPMCSLSWDVGIFIFFSSASMPTALRQSAEICLACFRLLAGGCTAFIPLAAALEGLRPGLQLQKDIEPNRHKSDKQ